MSGLKWGWEKQWNAQEGLCWICLEPMDKESIQEALTPSVEHIVPLSRGGGNRWNNKLLAHKICNSLRGAPFIWVKLSIFRRAAMKRIQGRSEATSVDGVDLGCSYVLQARAPRRSASTRWPETEPSELSGKALRVTLAELSSLK